MKEKKRKNRREECRRKWRSLRFFKIFFFVRIFLPLFFFLLHRKLLLELTLCCCCAPHFPSISIKWILRARFFPCSFLILSPSPAHSPPSMCWNMQGVTGVPWAGWKFSPSPSCSAETQWTPKGNYSHLFTYRFPPPPKFLSAITLRCTRVKHRTELRLYGDGAKERRSIIHRGRMKKKKKGVRSNERGW